MKNDIPYLLKTISEKMSASADADLKRHGITFSQLRVLGFLNDQGGSASQRDVQKHLGASHPTVVGLVNRLEKNGFVVSSVDEQDRRARIVQMTEKAQLLGNELEKEGQRATARLLKGLSKAEREELLRLLQRLSSNVD